MKTKRNKPGRRTFLKVSAASGAAVLISPFLKIGKRFSPWMDPVPAALGAPAGSDEKLLARNFKVDVKGLSQDLPGVVEVDCGRVTIAVEEATQGDKPEYRSYTYGSHEYEEFTLVIQQGPGSVKLEEWFKTARQGRSGGALRRDISVYCLARDKSTVLRTYQVFGCLPVRFGTVDPSGKRVKLTCKVDRVEVV